MRSHPRSYFDSTPNRYGYTRRTAITLGDIAQKVKTPLDFERVVASSRLNWDLSETQMATQPIMICDLDKITVLDTCVLNGTETLANDAASNLFKSAGPFRMPAKGRLTSARNTKSNLKVLLGEAGSTAYTLKYTFRRYLAASVKGLLRTRLLRLFCSDNPRTMYRAEGSPSQVLGEFQETCLRAFDRSRARIPGSRPFLPTQSSTEPFSRYDFLPEHVPTIKTHLRETLVRLTHREMLATYVEIMDKVTRDAMRAHRGRDDDDDDSSSSSDDEDLDPAQRAQRDEEAMDEVVAEMMMEDDDGTKKKRQVKLSVTAARVWWEVFADVDMDTMLSLDDKARYLEQNATLAQMAIIEKEFILDIRIKYRVSMGHKIRSAEELTNIWQDSSVASILESYPGLSIRLHLSNVQHLIPRGLFLDIHRGMKREDHLRMPFGSTLEEVNERVKGAMDREKLRAYRSQVGPDAPLEGILHMQPLPAAVLMPAYGGMGQGLDPSWMMDPVPKAPTSKTQLSNIFRRDSLQFYPYIGAGLRISGSSTYNSNSSARDADMLRLIHHTNMQVIMPHEGVPGALLTPGSKHSAYFTLHHLLTQTDMAQFISNLRRGHLINIFCLPAAMRTEGFVKAFRKLVPKTIKVAEPYAPGGLREVPVTIEGLMSRPVPPLFDPEGDDDYEPSSIWFGQFLKIAKTINMLAGDSRVQGIGALPGGVRFEMSARLQFFDPAAMNAAADKRRMDEDLPRPTPGSSSKARQRPREDNPAYGGGFEHYYNVDDEEDNVHIYQEEDRPATSQEILQALIDIMDHQCRFTPLLPHLTQLNAQELIHYLVSALFWLQSHIQAAALAHIQVWDANPRQVTRLNMPRAHVLGLLGFCHMTADLIGGMRPSMSFDNIIPQHIVVAGYYSRAQVNCHPFELTAYPVDASSGPWKGLRYLNIEGFVEGKCPQYDTPKNLNHVPEYAISKQLVNKKAHKKLQAFFKPLLTPPASKAFMRGDDHLRPNLQAVDSANIAYRQDAADLTELRDLQDLFDGGSQHDAGGQEEAPLEEDLPTTNNTFGANTAGLQNPFGDLDPRVEERRQLRVAGAVPIDHQAFQGFMDTFLHNIATEVYLWYKGDPMCTLGGTEHLRRGPIIPDFDTYVEAYRQEGDESMMFIFEVSFWETLPKITFVRPSKSRYPSISHLLTDVAFASPIWVKTRALQQFINLRMRENITSEDDAWAVGLAVEVALHLSGREIAFPVFHRGTHHTNILKARHFWVFKK